MPETCISVTEAARNFAECVNRVRYQGASFLLQKNGTPVARLVPVELELADERVKMHRTAESANAEHTDERPKAEDEAPGPDNSHRSPVGHDVLNW